MATQEPKLDYQAFFEGGGATPGGPPGQQPSFGGIGGPPGHRVWRLRIPVTSNVQSWDIPFFARRVSVRNETGYPVFVSLGDQPPSTTAYDLTAPALPVGVFSIATDGATRISVMTNTSAVQAVAPNVTGLLFVGATEDGSEPFGAQTEAVQEVAIEPASGGGMRLQLDPMSGLYSVYAATRLTFQNTCWRVRVTLLTPALYDVFIGPQAKAGPTNTQIALLPVAWRKPVEITGPIQQLWFDAYGTEMSGSSQQQQACLVYVEAYYDPENPQPTGGGGNMYPITPNSAPVGLSMLQAFVSYNLFSGQSLGAGASGMFSITLDAANHRMFLGRQRYAYLFVNCNQSYTLVGQGLSAPSLENDAVATQPVSLATNHAATAGWPTQSNTWLDGSINWSGLTGSIGDAYELVAAIGCFPGYLFQITNTGAASANVSAWVLIINNLGG